MAELKKIETMIDQLATYVCMARTEPDWIRGYEKRDNHLSGALRSLGNMIDDKLMFTDEDGNDTNLSAILEEAAETLDDAHQEWLEQQLANRKRRYIVIGHIPDMEQEIVVYDADDGGHAERMFAAALDEMKEAEEISTAGYSIDFILEIDGDGSVFYCQDQFGFHGNKREEAK